MNRIHLRESPTTLILKRNSRQLKESLTMRQFKLYRKHLREPDNFDIEEEQQTIEREPDN